MGYREYIRVRSFPTCFRVGGRRSSSSREPTFKSEILSYWDAIASWQDFRETGIGWLSSKEAFPRRGSGAACLTPEGLLCFQGGRPADWKPRTKILRKRFQAFHLEQAAGIIFSSRYGCPAFPLTEKALFWSFSARERPRGFAGHRSAGGAGFPIFILSSEFFSFLNRG